MKVQEQTSRLHLPRLALAAVMVLASWNVSAAAQPNRNAATPQSLRQYAESGDVVALAEVIGKGVAVDAADSDGWTAAHFAAANGKTDVLKALVSAGAQLNMRTTDGTVPLMLAVLGGHVQAIKYLRAAGAEIGVKDAAGASVLKLAIKGGKVDVVSAVTDGISPLEYLSDLEDLLPLKSEIPDVDAYVKQLELNRPVNPSAFTRDDMVRLLRDVGVLTEDDLSNDSGLSLATIERPLRRYCSEKNLIYDQITLGRILSSLESDYASLEDKLLTRMRTASGAMSGNHGFYEMVMPRIAGPGKCKANNTNMFAWSEGNTFYNSDSINPARYHTAKILRKGGTETWHTTRDTEVKWTDLPSVEEFMTAEDECKVSRGWVRGSYRVSLKMPYPLSRDQESVNRYGDALRKKMAEDSMFCRSRAYEQFYTNHGDKKYGSALATCNDRYGKPELEDIKKMVSCAESANSKTRGSDIKLQEYIIEEDDGSKYKLRIGDGAMKIVLTDYFRCKN